MPINLPTYEQQQQAITLLQELGVDVDTLITGRVVKSVQRGVANFPTSGTTQSSPLEITISPVDINKCAVYICGHSLDGTDRALVVQQLGTDKLYIASQRNTSWGTAVTRMSWEVVEYY